MIESEKSRYNHDCHLNIAYGPTRLEKLDIYGDNLPAESPLFVFVHGGYWQMEDFNRWKSAYVVPPLVQKGIRVIVVGYDLYPRVTLEQLVGQVQKSFEWISNYIAKNSIKSVSFAGHSAGGPLVACGLTKEFIETVASNVKLFAYLISGVYDYTELRFLMAANANNVLSLNDDNVKKLSPQFHDFIHLQSRDIKIYVYSAEFESEKFKQQSKDFAEITLKNLPFVTSEVYSGVDHFDIVEKLLEPDFGMTQLIVRNALQVQE